MEALVHSVPDFLLRLQLKEGKLRNFFPDHHLGDGQQLLPQTQVLEVQVQVEVRVEVRMKVRMKVRMEVQEEVLVAVQVEVPVEVQEVVQVEVVEE